MIGVDQLRRELADLSRRVAAIEALIALLGAEAEPPPATVRRRRRKRRS